MATQSSKLLDHARAAEGETSQKLAEVRTARDAALLKSDDTAAILKLDDEIAQLERIAKRKRTASSFWKVKPSARKWNSAQNVTHS